MMAGAKLRGALRAVVFLVLSIILLVVPTGATAAFAKTIPTAAPTTAVLGGYDLSAKLLATVDTPKPTGRLTAPMQSPAPRGSRLVMSVGVAAETEAGLSRALGYSEKIETQMGPRGWTRESIESTVKDPAETHPVWDYTTGDKMPATAYVQRGGGYVVVNDESGELVQVSNLNKSGWKPVWEDPRFAR